MQHKQRCCTAAVIALIISCYLSTLTVLGNEQVIPEAIPDAITDAGSSKDVLFPIDVEEKEENNYAVIIRTYALKPSENPNEIPLTGFTKFGVSYELSEIIKKDNRTDETIQHSETITLDTASNDMNEILAQLSQEIPYEKDGYEGVLKLDLSTVTCEPAGYKTNTYTMKVTRDYNRLPSPDMADIPKTVTERGVTYSFDSVDYKPETTTSIDYVEVPTSYSAKVTYTATGSSKNVTGYTTTAVYNGEITRVLTDETVYKVYFISSDPIVGEEPEPEVEPEPIELIINDEPKAAATEINPALVLSAFSALASVGIIGYLAYRNMFNTTIYYKQGIEYKKIGQIKVNYKNDPPTINLNKFSAKTTAEEYVIELSKSAMKTLLKRKLPENKLRVVLKDKERIHVLAPYAVAEKYQFEVDFSEDNGEDEFYDME